MTAALFERTGRGAAARAEPGAQRAARRVPRVGARRARERPDPRPHRLRVHDLPAPEADRVDVAATAAGRRPRSPTTSTRSSASTSSTSAWSCRTAWSTANSSSRACRSRSASSTSSTRPRPVDGRAPQLAATDGFEHIDVLVDVDPATLALPVGCPTAFPKPRPGWCATPGAAPPATGMWERAVRVVPGRARRAARAVGRRGRELGRDVPGDASARCPGLRLLVDTGHVADWGGDPLELLELRRPRAAAPGQARARRRSTSTTRAASSTSPRCSAGSTSSTTGASSRSSTSTCPNYGWPLDDPRRLGARPRRARAPVAALTSSGRVRARSGGQARGAGGPPSATTRPGSASVDEQRAAVGPAEAAVRGHAVAVDRRGSRRSLPSGSTTRTPCSTVDAT